MVSKKKKEQEHALLEYYYQQGLVLHRSHDFYERIQTFIVSRTRVLEVSQLVKANLPHNVSVDTFVPNGGSIIYFIGHSWKAAIQLEWMNEEISYYRFWFAQPVKKLAFEQWLEMNIVATAVEKAFLSVQKDCLVIMSYASAAEREFEIGPSRSSSKLPDLGSILNAPSVPDAAVDVAYDMTLSSMKGLSKDTSINAFTEYWAERKSEKKLGAQVVKDYLGARYVGRPASSREIDELFQRMEQERLQQMRAKKRFCRKCGNPLAPNDIFCGTCGQAIMSS